MSDTPSTESLPSSAGAPTAPISLADPFCRPNNDRRRAQLWPYFTRFSFCGLNSGLATKMELGDFSHSHSLPPATPNNYQYPFRSLTEPRRKFTSFGKVERFRGRRGILPLQEFSSSQELNSSSVGSKCGSGGIEEEGELN